MFRVWRRLLGLCDKTVLEDVDLDEGTGVVVAHVRPKARSFIRIGDRTPAELADCLDDLGLLQSVGVPAFVSTAMAESFFAAMKVERVNRTVYPTRQRARDDIAQYIELW